MNVLVDEDLASRELLARLGAVVIGRVFPPARGSSDEQVWELAQAHEAAILTGNVVDFLRSAATRPSHHGLLLVYRRNDPTRDLQAIHIAAGVASIASAYPRGIDDLVLVVNDFAGR